MKLLAKSEEYYKIKNLDRIEVELHADGDSILVDCGPKISYRVTKNGDHLVVEREDYELDPTGKKPLDQTPGSLHYGGDFQRKLKNMVQS